MTDARKKMGAKATQISSTTSAAAEAEQRASTTSMAAAVTATKLSAAEKKEIAETTLVIARLTPEQRKAELKQRENIIAHGYASAVLAGRALQEIRDGKLYLDDYASFDEYLRERWHTGRSQAYRQIDAANVVDVLGLDAKDMTFPTQEGVLRPLVGLKPKDAKAAWKTATEKAGNGMVTAKLVKEAAALFKPVKPKKARAEAPPAQSEVKAAAPAATVEPTPQAAKIPAPSEPAKQEAEGFGAKEAIRSLLQIAELIKTQYKHEETARLALELVDGLRQNVEEEFDDRDLSDEEMGRPTPENDYDDAYAS